MKLLIVLESWGNGGTEMYVETAYRSLHHHFGPYQIHVALLRGPASEMTELKQRDWIHDVHDLGNRNPIQTAKRLRQLCKSLQPDWCHLHVYTSTLLCSIATWKLAKTKVACTFHLPVKQWNIAYRCSFRAASALPDAMIGASELTTSELQEWRRDATCIPPPITCANDRTGDSANQKQFHIVGCGRLARQKDWPTLIYAIGQLDGDIRRQLSVTIVGDGDQLAILKNIVSEVGVNSQVRLVGRKSHQEAMSIVADADLFVLPSRYEGFGMSAVEAMIRGVPVITANFSAATEYLHEGKTGQQFPIGDRKKLAELIVWHMQHPEGSQKIALAGKQLANERYRPERIANLHHQLYQNRAK